MQVVTPSSQQLWQKAAEKVREEVVEELFSLPVGLGLVSPYIRLSREQDGVMAHSRDEIYQDFTSTEVFNRPDELETWLWFFSDEVIISLHKHLPSQIVKRKLKGDLC